MITLNLELPNHQYPIYIGSNLFNDANLILPHLRNHTVAIVSNEVVAPLYLNKISQSISSHGIDPIEIVLPDGETYKNWSSLNCIFDNLLSAHAERNTTLIALGGGVIGDTTGFAAACYQRGMPYIQIPTTLLAQVDSSVGGKTAINHPLGKNMIGAFYQPQAVLADISTLTTLPDRELSAGLAEVIKYGLLGDSQFFLWLEENIPLLRQRNDEALIYAIHQCCRMKAEIVHQDEKEQGVRALLNLGHTFGHAIEAGLGFGTWLHGEAVAAGMVLAAELSHTMGWLTEHEIQRIVNLIRAAGLPVYAPDLGNNCWLDWMSHDKKVAHGKIRFILLPKLGSAQIVDDVPSAALSSVLNGRFIQK